MQQSRETDLFCETTCKFFRCSERFLKIVRTGGNKRIMCQMIEGDECIGYKCKYALCSFRPPSLDISTGICAQKKKKTIPKKHRIERRTQFDDDPLKYRQLLDKKMRKNFKIKDFI